MTPEASVLQSTYSRIVVWGLKSVNHSHRYIHAGFFESAGRLHSDAIWVDDKAENADAVTKGSLVITAGVCADHLPVVDSANYVLHNVDAAGDPVRERARWINLQVWTADVANRPGMVFDPVTRYDPDGRVLYQPWGTNLPDDRFRRPLRPIVRYGLLSFFVGSIWNNELDQGNLREISVLRGALARRHKLFVTLTGIDDAWNVRTIRASAAAPAIGGRWQVDVGYLPCRLFKNVSFGHLGASNVSEFSRMFGDAILVNPDVEALLDAYFALPSAVFKEMLHTQQQIVRQHTYEVKLANIARALDA